MIRRVVIRNFKSLDVEVDLDPVTVLVGRSGTGKTNFVHAVQFLRDLLSAPNPKLKYSPELIPATSGDDIPMEFWVEFELEGLSGLFSYELDLAFKHTSSGVGVPKEKLSLGNRVIFCQQGGKWVDPPPITNSPKPDGIMLGKLEGVQDISVAHVALTRSMGCYDFPGQVCVGGGTANQNGWGLLDNATNYSQAFDAILGDLKRLADLEEINSALKRLNSSFDGINPKRSGGSGLVVTHNFGGVRFALDIAQESEGFRRFFAHLLALYQAPAKEVLFFEEPEKGIHPGALETLSEELKTAPEQGRGQVILTTHSPELLDFFKPNNLRVVEIEDSVTAIGKVDEGQLKSLKDDLLRPGELLTVDVARVQGSVQTGE